LRATHHVHVKGRNGKVSKALLPAALACALAALAAEHSAPPRITNEFVATPVAVSCHSVEREIRFEMLPADAEPEMPAGRGLPVCLAVYRPNPAP